MNDNENNFLDPKTILAILLVVGLWYGWSNYLNHKYPNQNANIKTVEGAAKTEVNKNLNEFKAPATLEAKPSQQNSLSDQPVAPQEINVTNEASNFIISSKGMGIRNDTLEKYTKRDGTKITFSQGLDKGLFELHLLDTADPLLFKVNSAGENHYVGVAQLGGMTITRTMTYHPESFSFSNQVEVNHPSESFKGLSLLLAERRQTGESSGSFFAGNAEKQEFLVTHDANKLETINVSSAKESIEKVQTQVSILALASQYFAAAVMDKSEIVPEARMLYKPGDEQFTGALNYRTTSSKDNFKFAFMTYVGPKDHDILEKVDPEFGSIIDLGFFGVIGRILLVILKWFYTYLGNWGFSIIALTLLVRALVAPFNIASYRSMKKMQKIQPAMKALRERYKEDSQAQQRETMALMKREKVNPLGGCLPMLLQMPIFFALFRTLGQSIDLYQAPFVFWIHDLSMKDPFYILPILVGLTFFVQQKITPTTMDPQQAKVMQFMPIMFTFFMISLPSGLTLYTFVSTLFAIIQQRIFMRDRHVKALEATQTT